MTPSPPSITSLQARVVRPAGALVIGDLTIDLREGHESPGAPTSSGNGVLARDYLKFTGIVNGAERWA